MSLKVIFLCLGGLKWQNKKLLNNHSQINKRENCYNTIRNLGISGAQ